MRPPTTLSRLTSDWKTSGFDYVLDGLFTVQVQKRLNNGVAPRRARIIDYRSLYEGYKNCDVNFVDELFVVDRPVKPVFDFDIKLDAPVSVRVRDSIINSLIADLSRYCGSPFTSDLSDWVILYCPYDLKLSVHLIYNGGFHYSSLRAQKAHLVSLNIPESLAIDYNIYRTNGSLRCLGSSKWDENAPNPFRWFKRDVSSVTYVDFLSAMAQFIPVGSRLIEVDLPSQPSQQRPGYVEQIDELPDVRQLVALLQQNPEAGDLIVSAKRNISDGVIGFDLDEACTCRHRNTKVVLRLKQQIAMIKCAAGECADKVIGYTERSAQYLRQRECLIKLEEYELCAPHMPIFDSPDRNMRSFGFFDLTAAQFFQDVKKDWPNLQQDDPDLPPEWFCYFYEPEGPCLLDIHFFNFLRDFYDGYDGSADWDAVTKRLISYVRLFVCTVHAADKWFVRSRAGIVELKRTSVEKEFIRPLVYYVEKEIGPKKDRKIILVEKQFFPVFEKWGTHHFASFHSGPFEIRRRGPLCITPTKAINTEVCEKKYLELDNAMQNCLQALVNSYFDMAVAYEPEDTRAECKEFLCRWLCEVLFRPMNPTQIMPLFMSGGGGQGKTTLGNFICEALGAALARVSNAKDLLSDRFTAGSNKFNLLDEIVVNRDEAEKLKEYITAKYVEMRDLYSKPYRAPSMRNFFATTNRPVCMAVNARSKERRICVFKFLDVTQYDLQQTLVYNCPFCENMGRDRFGNINLCPHSFINHESFMQLWYTQVLESSDGKTTRGEYFDAMVGMLSILFKRMDRSVPLAQSMILTKATVEVQIQADTEAAKYIDHCLKRGFHFSPSICPDRLNTVVEYRESDLLALGQQAPPVWMDEVTISAFYQGYTDYCLRNNSRPQPLNFFIEELDALSLSRRNRSIANSTLVKCAKLQWKTEGASSKPSWVRINDSSFDGPVINMGLKEEWVRVSAGARIVSDSRSKIVRSASRANINGSNSRSSLSNSPEADEEYVSPTLEVLSQHSQNSQLLRQQQMRAEHDETTRSRVARLRPREQPIGVVEAVRQLRKNDEQHAYMRPLLFQGDVMVDENAQDAVAFLVDQTAKKKHKAMRMHGLDMECEEVSSSESEAQEADPEEW